MKLYFSQAARAALGLLAVAAVFGAVGSARANATLIVNSTADAVDAALVAILGGTHTARASEVLEIPVEFHIVNSNTSGVPCPPDNAAYIIRGHLTGPAGALQGAGERVVTFYQYGASTGEWNWRFREVPGYDWPSDMAKLGHTSLTIDMLGYDSSDHPNGFDVCFGSQADITHQIVQQLRAGAGRGGYVRTDGGIPISFQRVVLAGHDVAGAIVEIEAYSYKDIDGLMVMGWADSGFTPYIITLFSERVISQCPQGGQEAEPGSASGYWSLARETDFRMSLLIHAEPSVVEAVIAMANLNPCGYGFPPPPESAVVDRARAREITVPVLFLYSDDDPVFDREGRENQQNLFTGSADKTTVFTAGSHYPMLETSVEEYREVVADWLCSRGFVSDGAGCGTPGKATGGGQIDPLTGEPAVDSLTGEPLVLATMLLGLSSGGSSSGQAGFSFVAQYASGDSAPRGNLRYVDQTAGIDLRATSMLTFVISHGACGASSHATFSGKATVNGTANRDFRVEVEDCGSPGGADAFKISVPDQSYSASGTLIGGNIKVHR